MNAMLLKIYEALPTGLQKFLSRNTFLGKLRDVVLRNDGIPREVMVDVSWNSLQFKFLAPIKIAEKAKNRGIENTLLRHSLALLRGRENAVVFDVGTNYGFLSMVWAHSIARHGKVYSFEPHPKICTSIRSTINANGLNDRVILSNAAVGEQPGRITLFLYGTTSNIHSRNARAIAETEVEVVALDDFVNVHAIQRCDLLKIDTDGSELQVLAGARRLITAFRPIVIVETNGERTIVDWFVGLNYKLLDMKLQPVKDGEGELPPNLFAVPV